MAKSSMYGGIDMKMGNKEARMSDKMAPRAGAAKGQGNGMGGYNGGAVNKALGMIEGAAKASYYAGAGMQKGK